MPNTRTPQKREPLGWVEPFLEAFAKTGNVSEALRRAKVSRSTVYEHRARNEHFLVRWEEAKETGADEVEGALRKAAVKGVQTSKVIERTLADGTIERTKQTDVKPSVTAMIFLLKSLRPEIYRERNPLENINELDLTALADDELERFTELARKAQRRA